MTQQFLKLYVIITISLVCLVLAFGQLYNNFFANPEPSIQITVPQFQQLIANKQQNITTLNALELALPERLEKKFNRDGLLSVTLNQQEYLYIKGEGNTIYQVGPLQLNTSQPTNWLAFVSFYLLLGALLLIFIRPVFKDLSLLQVAANDFRQKPQRIELPLKNNSSIAPLAATFTKMSEQIEQFIQLHSDLSRIISHEIRTPLTRMRFALSISDNNEQEKAVLERDIEEIELRLEQYLSFARLEHQHSHFTQEDIELSNLIETEVNKFALYKELNFNLELNLKSACCEQSYMAIAMQNLLVNATKYAKQDITIISEQSPTHNRIIVIDDGPGLPINAQALINPFEQGHDDQLASGYGLGLYIVHRIASWHHGSVLLENNQPQDGAKITITWPKV